MKKKFLLGFAVIGLLFATTAVWAEVAEELLPSDTAFESYVSSELFTKATESLNADLLADVALQLAEGERVLQRPHFGISSDTVSRLAYRLAKDDSTKVRLKNAAEKGGKQKLLQEFADIDKEVQKALAGLEKPKFSVDDNPKAAATALYLSDFVEKAVRLNDANLLTTYSVLPDELKDVLGDQVSKEFADYLKRVQSKLSDKPSEDKDNLAKLDGVSRQRPPFPGPPIDGQRPPHLDPVRIVNIVNGQIQYSNPGQQYQGSRKASGRPVPPEVMRIARQIRDGQIRFPRPNTHGLREEFRLGNGTPCYQGQRAPGSGRDYKPVIALLRALIGGGLQVFPTKNGRWYSPRVGIEYDQISINGYGIAFVNYVQPGSPANNYGGGNGLQVGDIIYLVDNRGIVSPFEFEFHIGWSDFEVLDFNFSPRSVSLWLP
jgi:hypothetical protein